MADWRRNLERTVATRHGTSVAAWFWAHEGVPLVPLTRALDDADIRPIYVSLYLREEALQKRFDLLRLERSLFCRELRTHLKTGHAGLRNHFPFSRSFGNWASFYSDDRSHAVLSEIAQAIKDQAHPGWIPETSDDPVLVSAFRGRDLERFARIEIRDLALRERGGSHRG